MNKKIFVTGGAGFIGSNFVDYLNRVEPTWQITVFDDFSTGHRANLEKAVADVKEGTIMDSESLRDSMEGSDCVVHLAAIGSVPRSISAPIPTHEANVTGTLNVLEAARNLRIDHVIVASSSAVYGANPNLLRVETDWARPMSPYGVSKLATEAYANAYNFAYGMRTLALRFFNVYGPRQQSDSPYAAVIPRFLAGALHNKEIEIHGDGSQTRDFTFVSDVCAVLYRACKIEATLASPVNLAFGSNISVNRLIEVIDELLGTSTNRKHVGARHGDVKASKADSNLLNEIFPDLVPLPLVEGLRSTIEWHRAK